MNLSTVAKTFGGLDLRLTTQELYLYPLRKNLRLKLRSETLDECNRKNG